MRRHLTPPLLARAFCIILLTAAAAAAAHTTVIDDSGTLPHDAALALRWQQLAPRGAANNQMIGTLALHVKLNVAPWLHRTGRIYLVLPAQQPGALTASWTTQGRLIPGKVVTGQRTLVYAGPITTPFLEDMVQLTLSVDGRRVSQGYQINFRFEMDEE
jgi:hypothetical protein